jgi:phosphoglucosamine mutase
VLKFGTDGVRGVANRDLTPELVIALGRAAARVLGQRSGSFLVGRDTRISGPLLQAALSAGLAAEGASVTDLGVLSTPGVAFASAARNQPAAVISASHNPYPDNGVKLFASGGRKLSDVAQHRLEEELDRVRHDVFSGWGEPDPDALTGAKVGRLWADEGPAVQYFDHLLGTCGAERLDGMRLALDCAHGAAYRIAPRVLAALGADLDLLGNRPDGTNINQGCGSTHPSALQQAVVAAGAEAGLALDGDGDRVLAVDEQGQLVDGDQMLALCAIEMHESGTLRGDTVVVTVMTNLGFRHAMAGRGIAVHETPVGDRHVLEALEANGWALGGEQSGHLIFRDLATTGDGILTALNLLRVIRRRGRPLSELEIGRASCRERV